MERWLSSGEAFRAMEAILEDNYDTVSLLISMAINDVADVLKLKQPQLKEWALTAIRKNRLAKTRK